MKLYLEFRSKKSEKFWEVTVEDTEQTITYGRIGTEGRSKTTSFSSEAEAIKDAEKRAAEKIRKGYKKIKSKSVAAKKRVVKKITEKNKASKKIESKKKTTSIKKVLVYKPKGKLKNGKKEGLWKWFYSNGSLKKESSYKNGESNGPFTEYYKNGNKQVTGYFSSGERSKHWQWFHENGQLEAECTYRKGKREGEYNSYYPSGQLYKIMFYKDGKLEGNYKSHYPSGQIRGEYSCKNGMWQGPYTFFNDAGEVSSEGSYNLDYREGEQRVLDSNGKQIVMNYHLGIPDLGEKRWKEIGNIASKSDGGYYEKIKIIKKEIGVTIDSSDRVLTYMLAEGHLDINKEYKLWWYLKNNYTFLTGQQLSNLLERIELNEETMERFKDFEIEVFDCILMHIYHKDPEPFESNYQKYNKEIQNLFFMTKIRHGNTTADEVGESFKKEMAQHFAKKLFYNKAIGYAKSERGNSGIDMCRDKVWVLEENEVKIMSLRNTWDRNEQPGSDFYKYIEYFTTQDLLWKALLELGLNERGSFYNVKIAKDAIKIASIEELSTILYKIDGNGRNAKIKLYWILQEARLSDTPEDLEKLAKILNEENNGGSIRAAEEAVIVCSILKLKEKKAEVPEWYDEYLVFRASEIYVDHERCDWKQGGIVQWAEALQYLGKERAYKIIDKRIKLKYMSKLAFPMLHAFQDPELWTRALKKQEKKLKKGDAIHSVEQVILGLSLFGEKGLDFLIDYMKKVEKQAFKEIINLGILAMFASELDEWDEKYDQYISFYFLNNPYPYEFDTMIAPHLKRIFKKLSPKRAEKILIEQTDIKYEYITLPFCAINESTTEKALSHMFHTVTVHSKQIKELANKYNNWLREAIGEYSELTQPYIKQSIKDGADSRLIKWYERHIKIDEIKKEIEEEGATIAKAQTAAEECQVLIENYLKEKPKAKTTTVYWLEPSKEVPDESNYNRLGGIAVGFDKKSYPTFEEEPMDHIVTLDLKTMPALAKRIGKEGIRAVSLFIQHSDMLGVGLNPGSGKSAIEFLTEEDLKKGVYKNKAIKPIEELKSFTITEIKVPVSVFTESPRNYDIKRIRGQLYGAPAYVLGEAMWIQEPEWWGDFIMQFSNWFAQINLGDNGKMYVFTGAALWQCY